MKITRHPPHWIKITGDETALHSGSIESQSVEANLLFEILNKLEEIRCGNIDIENTIQTLVNLQKPEPIKSQGNTVICPNCSLNQLRAYDNICTQCGMTLVGEQ